MAVGGVPNDGSDTDAGCQRQSDKTAYCPAATRWPPGCGSTAPGALQLGKLFLRARDLLTGARDLAVSVRELFVGARGQDVARIGLFLVQRGIHQRSLPIQCHPHRGSPGIYARSATFGPAFMPVWPKQGCAVESIGPFAGRALREFNSRACRSTELFRACLCNRPLCFDAARITGRP